MDIGQIKFSKPVKDEIKSLKKGKVKKDAKVSSKTEPKFFEQLLEVTELREINLELDELIEKIDEVGEKFAKNPIPENLNEYKSLIKSFLEKVTNKIYKIKERMCSRFFIKQKIYITVEKVNKELEELTKMVLENQAENINLMAKIEEIRGLLIDLYH